MLNTENTRLAHYDPGFYRIGSGPKKILILGSCRVLPYVNYFHYLNTKNDFTVNLINVVNYSFTEKGDHHADTAKAMEEREKNAQLLAMIRETEIFLHEHIANYGMVNTDRSKPKNIYQFGMNARCDVSIPNFNNVYIMAQEFVDFDAAIKAKAVASAGKLPDSLVEEIKERGLKVLEQFLKFCREGSLPEFADLFDANWRTTRYFWTGSHISNKFTSAVMRLMNDKFLHFDIPAEFWKRILAEDLYETPHTPITEYDVRNYGLAWPQPIQPLKI